jgi:hypothetical protein
MGTQDALLPRLVALLDGETVPYAPNLAVDVTKRGWTPNMIGMAIAGEALRALRAYKADSVYLPLWLTARNRLAVYLLEELENGLWGNETLCPTPHDAYHLAIAMFSRLVAVESQNAELLRLTAEHCRRLGRLCATLSDPTGEVISAGVRVPFAKGGKAQKRPVHSALTAWWRAINDKPQEGGFKDSTRLGPMRVMVPGPAWGEPMYVGLRATRGLWRRGDDLGCVLAATPGPVRLARTVIVHRWPEGHQVEMPRRGNESGMTKGSANPNGTCDWVRAEYGKGKRGASLVSFGMLWQTPAPEVPKGATRIVMGPEPASKASASEIRRALGVTPEELEVGRRALGKVRKATDRRRMGE